MLKLLEQNKTWIAGGWLGIIGFKSIAHHLREPHHKPLHRDGRVVKDPDSPTRDVLQSIFLAGLTNVGLRGLRSVGFNVPKMLTSPGGFYGTLAAYSAANRMMHLQDPGVAVTTSAAVALLNYGSYNMYKKLIPAPAKNIKTYLDHLEGAQINQIRENLTRVAAANPKVISFLKAAGPLAAAAASIPISFSILESTIKKWHNKAKLKNATLQTSYNSAGEKREVAEPSFIPTRRVADELRVGGSIGTTYNHTEIREALRF